MKEIGIIILDTVVASIILFAGFGLHSLADAPGWLMPPFAIPSILYIRFRLALGQITYQSIAITIAALMLALFILGWFVPREHKEYGMVLIVVVFGAIGQIVYHRRRKGNTQIKRQS